jgi:hypothetical protein
MVDLSIVVVSWNVCDLLRRCLASLPAGASGLSYETFVVDNASSDASVMMVRQEFPTIHLIQNEENRGFTRANNQALAVAAGRHVVLLNPDTEVEPGAMQALVAYLDEHADVGAVGPQLIFADGSLQSSRRRFPTLRTMFVESTVLQRWFARSATVRRFYMQDQPDDREQDVDWLVGACLMVRREAMAVAGLMDERFFMYSEETDWCLRIKQHGWRIVYVPSARIMHHEARSSDQTPVAKHVYFHTSRIAYAAKHFGLRQAQMLRLFLLATYACQIAEEAVKWLIGHKRVLRAQRITVYRQVLASGLRP